MSEASDDRPRPAECRWTLAVTTCALLATAVVQMEAAFGQRLLCRLDALWQGELWRLITGPLVHASWSHALRDLSVLLLIGLLYERQLRQRFAVALVSSIVIAPLAVFVADPTITLFFGLSGTVHAVLTAALIWQVKRRRSWWLVGLIGALIVKLGVEAVTGTLLFPLELPSDVQPAVVAHLAGAACGVLASTPLRRKEESKWCTWSSES